MIEFFTISSNDQSYYYLGQLFGSVGTVLVAPGSTGATATSSVVLSLLGVMFKTLNTTALIIGAIIVTYTTVVGLLKTAQEGEFLGKQWNSLWVPLRMVMGIASLFPTGAGYSALQVLLMWVILQGVGAADTLWNTVLNYVSIFGSPYAKASIPTTVGINQDVQLLYQDLVCADAAQRGADGQTFQDRHLDPSGSSGQTTKYYYCAWDYPSSAPNPPTAGSNPTIPNSDPFCKQPKLSVILQNPKSFPTICNYSLDPSKGSIVTCAIGPGANQGIGYCGSITMSDVSALGTQCTNPTNITTIIKCAAFQAQAAEVPLMVQYLELMAAQTNEFDHDYMAFYAQDTSPTASTSTPAPDWLLRYCTNQITTGDPAKSCCLYTSPLADFFAAIFGSSAQGQSAAAALAAKVTPNVTCSYKIPKALKNGPFPVVDNASANNPTDYGNMNLSPLADSILWPCGLEPTAANQFPTTCMQGVTAAGNFIMNQVNNYTNYINNQVGAAMSAYITSSPPSALTGWEADAQQSGWLLAGGYYYTMAQTNGSNLKAAIPEFSVAGSDVATNANNPLVPYRNNFGAAAAIVNKILNSATGGSNLPGMPQMQAVSSNSGISVQFLQNLALSAAQLGTSGTNPLSAMQMEGEVLLVAAQIIYLVTMMIMFTLVIVSSISFIGLGTGIGSNPVGAGVSFLGNWIMGLVLAFMAWAITFGGMLAIYMPLIPYIVFTFAAIGWFTGVIEAMVAAPFIALGILSPGGQHEILGRAEPALMLLLNVFLRPSLMIMGMMIAMLFATVVVAFINAGFLGAMDSVNAIPGPIETILFISIYTSIITTALNKCFALIYLLPERVLTWIGGQAVSYGEAESVAQVKSSAESMLGTMSSAMKGTADAGMSAATAWGQKGKQPEAPKADTKGGGAGGTNTPPPAAGA